MSNSVLRIMRENFPLTIGELSKKIHIDVNNLNQYELKKSYPSIKNAIKLSNFFNYSIDSTGSNYPVSPSQFFRQLLVFLLSFALWSNHKEIHHPKNQYQKDNHSPRAASFSSSPFGWNTASNK